MYRCPLRQRKWVYLELMEDAAAEAQDAVDQAGEGSQQATQVAGAS